MPSRTVPGGGALSAIGSLRNFATVMRELSFDAEREQAERLPRILVIAPETSTARDIGNELTGVADSAAVTAWPLENAARGFDPYDAIVIFNPASNDAFVQAREKAGLNGLKIFDLASIDSGAATWPEELRARIATTLPDLAPALGRWFPAFRPAATKAVIDETARVNAQFALVSNLPAAIPVLGALAAAGADFYVLTKNQVMMVFKLAAIHGRDLNDHWSIVRDLLPVVGVGFLWRTLAREASSFLPLLAGTAPKVAIAYTGTIAAGKGAEYYYRFGKKPSREQLREFYDQAATSLKRLPLAIPAFRSRPEPDWGDTESGVS